MVPPKSFNLSCGFYHLAHSLYFCFVLIHNYRRGNSMNPSDLQKIVEALDLSNITYTENLRRDTQTNKKAFLELQSKYPGVWETCKELIYWKLHCKEPDFVKNQFCKCGSRCRFDLNSFQYREYCSTKCTRIYTAGKAKQTNLEKYGCEYALQNKSVKLKQKQTNQERYGGNSPMNSKDVLNKMRHTTKERYGHEHIGVAKRKAIQDTVLNKYGVSSVGKLDSVKAKIKETNLEKYGTEQYLSSMQAKQKIAETNLKRYGSENVFGSKEIQEKIKQTNLERYGVEQVAHRPDVQDKIKATNMQKYGYENPMSSKEVQNRAKQTNLERYGVENPAASQEVKDKIKETNLERYGTEYAISSEEIQNKIKETNLERYGTERPFGNANVQDKIKITNLEKYGSVNPMQSQEIQNKVKQTNLEKYGYEYIGSIPSIQNKIKETNLERYGLAHANQAHIKNINDINREFLTKNFIDAKGFYDLQATMDYFNIGETTARIIKHKFDILNPNKLIIHKTQTQIYEFVREQTNTEVFMDDRKLISPKELDIVVPELKFAIEYDGLLYHSFGYSTQAKWDTWQSESNEKFNHIIKTNLCEEQGIQLFHIFENEWLDPNKREIWKSMILNKIGRSKKVYARKTEIQEVQERDKNEFLNTNHIQGTCSSRIDLGLIHENELVALMTFGKSRFNKKYEYELLRFCNKRGYSVIGGASKIFKYFLKEYKPESIISYANRRWSQGNLYENLGFSCVGSTDPNYFYFHEDGLLHSRQKFQKHMLKDLLQAYDPSLTESQNMYNNGYRKIYDCGNLIYEYNN